MEKNRIYKKESKKILKQKIILSKFQNLLNIDPIDGNLLIRSYRRKD